MLDYKNNNVYYENTAELKIGDTATPEPTPSDTDLGTNKFNIKLDQDAVKARNEGYLNFNSGNTMVNTDEYSQADIRKILGHKESTGEYNTTDTLASDYVEQQEEYINSGQLWRDTLGSTAYADLKHKCGLKTNDSYTDYYNKTGYVPKGFEMEAKLLLAEEKKMKYYTDYASGKISKSDFLYQAYGKDLMKENGYDLSSKLFWYNKAKKNDFTNPLDNDTFVTQLITDSEKLWQDESWYKDCATRTLDSTMSGLVTGSELSTENFQKVFGKYVEALKPYFDNDVKKIMTYYQAGYLGSAFSPFVDIDGDNKYDYYYHTDGKLYAIKGSSGTGESTCEVSYNDDGSIHSVQVNEGLFDGWGDSLWEGFKDFFIGFGDLFVLVPGLINTDIMANYEAWKKRTIADEDRVVFDSMDNWNGDDWGNAIAKGIGTVSGMIVMLFLTAGIGNGLDATKDAAQAGAKFGAEASKITTKEAATSFIDNIQKEAMALSGKKAQQAFIDNALKTASKEFAKNATLDAVLKQGAKDIGGSIARATVKNIGRTAAGVVIGKGGFANTLSSAKGGTLINSTLTKVASKAKSTGFKKFATNAWTRSVSNAFELAVRDYISVTTQLQAKNKALKYLETVTDGEVKSLSDSEIAGRSWLIAGTDLVVSSMFRAVGSQGFTSRIIKNSDTILQNVTQETASTIKNYASHLKAYCRLDSFFDIFENVTTSAVQAAVSNPYAKLGSKESFTTAMQAITNPSFIASNIYATVNNLYTWGGRQGKDPISTSIYDDRINAIARQMNIEADALANEIGALSNALTKSRANDATRVQEALDTIAAKTQETLNNPKGSKIDNLLKAANDLDKLFTEDVTASINKEILEAFGISGRDYASIQALIRNYNKEHPENKIGFVTGKVLHTAQKENDVAVANAYKAVLDIMVQRSKALEEKQTDVANIFLRGRNFVINKSMKKSKAYIDSLIAQKTYEASGVNFDHTYEAFVNSFICKRFEMLTDITEDDTLRKDTTNALAQYLNSEYFKLHSLSTDSVAGTTSYTLVPVYADDDKEHKTPINYKLDAVNADTDNIIIQLLSNYEDNKDTINLLRSKGLFSTELNKDGTISINTSNISPWYALAIDNSKHNDLLKARASDKGLKAFMQTLDAVAYMFNNTDLEDMDIVDYDEPLLLKVKVATGNTNGSGNKELVDVYLIPNKIGGGLNPDEGTSPGDIANRLMALQGILYSTYGLFTQAQKGVVDNLTATKYLAQLGTLLQEGKAMDPFYDFLKLFNSDKPEDREKALKDSLPNAMIALLSKCKFNMSEGTEPTDTILSRKQIMAFVKAGVFGEQGEYKLLQDIISKASSAKNGTTTEVATVAQEILDYVSAVDKINNTLRILNDFADNSKKELSSSETKQIQDCVTILKTNQDLQDSLRKDGLLPELVEHILKENSLETFSQGSQKRDSHLETLSKNLLRLSGKNTNEIKEVLKKFLDEDLISVQRVKENPFELSKQYLIRQISTLSEDYFSEYKDKRKLIDVFNAMNTSEFKDFLRDPESFIVNFNLTMGTYATIDIDYFENLFVTKSNGTGLRPDYNFLLGLTLSNKFTSYSTKDDFREAIDYTEDTLYNLYTKASTNKNSTEFRYLQRLYKIATDDDLDINQLVIEKATPSKYKRPFSTLMVKLKDGSLKEFGELIYNNNKASTILVESIVDDTVDNTVKLIQTGIDYYWKDTTVTKKQNVVELDVLNFLPANLRTVFNKFVQNEDLATNTQISSKIKSQELLKELNNLITGSSSNATYTQYKAYKVLLNECIASGNFILKYNINDRVAMSNLKMFLTACGYDNFDLDKARTSISNIEGLHYKTMDTHNLNTTLSSQKFYAAARRYKIKNGLAKPVTKAIAGKDYVKVLYNLFSGITKFDDNTKIQLLDEKGEAIPYYSVIYKRTDPTKSFTFKNVFGNTETARSEKGTLAGGAQLLQYITKYRGLGVSLDDNTALDTKAQNSFIITSLAQKASEYLTKFSGKQAHTIQLVIPKDEQDTFKKMYDGKGFFKIMGESIGDTFILEPTGISAEDYLNTLKDRKFDIKEILPVAWTNDKSLKNEEFRSYEYISNETLFSELANLKLPNLLTVDDFYKFEAVAPDDRYSFDAEDYKNFCTANANKSVGELLALLENTGNNYYKETLKYELTIAKAYNDFAKTYLDTNSDLMELANERVYKILGAMLNDSNATAKFAYLLDPNNEVTSTDIEALAKALKNEIIASDNIFPTQATSTDNADAKNFSSLDVEKFNAYNNLSSDISVETLTKLINILRDTEDSLLITLSDDNDLVLPDNLISCLALFCEDSDGSLSIPMEYLMRSSKAQRDEFFAFIEELKAHPTEYNLDDADVNSLNSLQTALQNKLDLMYTIRPKANVEVKPSRLVFERNAVSAPTISVEPSAGFLSNGTGKLKQSQIDKINALLTAAANNTVDASPYIKLSSITPKEAESLSPFKQSLNKLLNVTVCRTSDKPASTLVYNMDTDEGIVNAITSVLAFVENTKLLLGDFNIPELNNLPIEVLMELGLKANALTTGAEYQAEFASSLVLRWDKENKTYDIVPLITSSADTEQSLYSYLVGKRNTGYDKLESVSIKNIQDDIAKNKNVHYLLLSCEKNAFRDSIDGYDETTRLLYLNDKNTQNALLTNIVKKAVLETNGLVTELPGEQELLNIVDAYYDMHTITSHDVYSNLVTSLKNLGVDDSVADLLYPTVESLYVGNPTNQSEQAIYDTLAKTMDSFKNHLPSAQFKIFSDAVTWGITNRALSSKDDATLMSTSIDIDTAFMNKKINKVEKLPDGTLVKTSQKDVTDLMQRVSNLVESIIENNADTKEYIKQNIKMLDPETQSYLLQKLLLERKDGFDLYSLFNMSSKTKSLFDIAQNIKPVVNTFSTDWINSSANKTNDINSLNVIEKTNHAVYDTEWFIPNDGEKAKFTDVYQIGFSIRKAVNDPNLAKQIDKSVLDSLEKHTILIKKNIMNNANRLYAENKDSYSAKIDACTKGKDFFEGTTEEDKGVKYHIIDAGPNATIEDDIKKAFEVFTKLLKDAGVTVIMSYNGKNTDAEEVSDNNLIRHWMGDSFFNDIDELDIQNDIGRKIWSRTTEGLSSDSMDTYRNEGVVYLNQAKAHDAVSDTLDEYELYLRIINNIIDSDNLFSKPLTDIADLFGEDPNFNKWSDDFKNVLKATSMPELKNVSTSLQSIIDSIDFEKSIFKRTNENIKQVMDAYKLTFEHLSRRMGLKDLEKLRNNFLDIFDSNYNYNYKKSIKDVKHRTSIRNLILGLVNNQCNLQESFSTVLKNDEGLYSATDIKDVDSLRTAFTNVLTTLRDAASLYKLDTSNPYNPVKVSNKNNAKSFYTEQPEVIAKYIYFANQMKDMQDADFSQKISKLNSLKATASIGTKEVLKSSLDNKISKDLFNKDFYNMLKDPTVNLLSLSEFKESKAKRDLYSHITRPLAKILGINKDSDDIAITDKVISETFSSKLKDALLNDLLKVYGATEEYVSKETDKSTERKAIKYTLLNHSDKYRTKMIEEFTSKDGLFTKGLRSKLALWSMGHERYKKTSSGEYGTLYIGEQLLTSTKAFKDLYGMYKCSYTTNSLNKKVIDYRDNAENTFYTLVWRQPLQQETPFQIMKVKVVDGDTFSMTTTTADNFFNGDFDGDQYFFSHPTALTNNDNIATLFDLQNKQTRLFYNLFDKDTILSDQVVLEEKYEPLARQVFSSKAVREAFKAVFANIELNQDKDGKAINVNKVPLYLGNKTLIDNFNQEFSKEFDRLVQDKAYQDLTPEEKQSLKNTYLENFGITLKKTSKGVTAISDNPYFKNDRETIMRLRATRQLYMQDNLANSGMDAPENGQMAKNYRWQKSSVDMDEAYRLFYNSTFSLKEDDIHLFTNLISNNNLSSKRLNNYLNSLEPLIGKDMVDWAKAYIKQDIIDYVKNLKDNNVTDSNAYKKAVERLSNLSNALQQNIIASKEYNNILNTIMPKVLSHYNAEDYEKYQALHSFMVEEGYLPKGSIQKFNPDIKSSTKGELNNGVDILMADTALFNKLFDAEQRKGYINVISKDNGPLQNLYLDMVFRGDEDNANISYRNNTEIITRDAITELRRSKDNNLIGLGSAIVAIDMSNDGSLVDTIGFFDNGNESLSYTKPIQINFASLTKTQRTNLLKLLTSSKTTGTIDSEDLNRALNADFETRTYQVAGLINSLGESISDLKNIDTTTLNHAKLNLISRVPLYTMLETNEIKLGLVGSKALKGTVMNGLNFEDRGTAVSVKTTKQNKGQKTKSTLKPDLVISSELFNSIKNAKEQDYKLKYTEINVPGNTKFKFIQLDDLAILNALNLQAQDKAKDRAIDTIGIIQGAHGTASMLNFSNMYLKFDSENNKWEFDPEGYTQLKNALHYHSLNNTLVDGNGARTIRLLRIAYMLNALPKEKQQLACLELTNNKALANVKNTLEVLYSAGDLGGAYGEDVEAYLYNKLSKEDKQKLFDSYSKSKDAILGRVAFSNEMNDQLVNRYSTYYDLDTDTPIFKKHQKQTNNIRVSNVQNYSDNADFLANLENSTHDLNTAYVSKESILRTILEENGSYLNKTTLKNAFNEGILEPTIGKLGTLYNGYNFIDNRESLQLSPYDIAAYEKQSFKKAGNKEPYSQYGLIRNNQRLLPLLSNSLNDISYKNTLDTVSSEELLKSKFEQASRYNQLRYVLPYFSEGTDAQIYDATNLYSNRFIDTLHQHYPTLDDEGTLRLDTKTFKTPVDNSGMTKYLTMEEQEQRIIQTTKSPKQVALLLKKKENLTKTDFDTLGLEDQMTLSSLLSSSKKDLEFLEELCKEYDVKTTYENYNTDPTESDPFSLLRAIRRNNKDVLHVAEFYSDDNGVKLVNSWLRSWGFKSSDNRDISLGNQTINMKTRFSSLKDKLLGDDYALLMYNSKYNRESYMLLNQYMNAEELIEAYDELTYSKDKWIKTLGQAKYNEYLAEVNKLSDNNIDAIRNKQQEIIKSHPTLSILVKAASRINKRLMLETRAHDPYAFLGWFTDLDYGTPSHMLGYKNVQVKTFVKNDFIKSLNFDLEKMPEGKLASIFHSSNYGYVPMVEKIASQLASSKAVDDLADYMKQTGYMQNVDTFNLAMDTLQNTLDAYFEHYNPTENKDREYNNKQTYNTLIQQCTLAGINVYNLDEYIDESSIYDLFRTIYKENVNLKESLNMNGLGSADYTKKLYQLYINSADSQKEEYRRALKINDMVYTVASTLVNMMDEIDPSKSLLSTINKSLLSLETNGKVLVNKYGQKINHGKLVNDYSSWHLFDDFLHLSTKDLNNKEYVATYVAKQALEGDVYLMDESVADQLEKKVFTKRIHSKLNIAIKKAKAIATTMVMSSPIQLIDRMINFPLFDTGVVSTADVDTFKYMPTAISTVTKFIRSGDTLTEEQIEADPNMKLLIRFLTAQGNLDLSKSSIRGEKMSVTNIPGLRSYLKLANTLYSAGNLAPRFAYFMNLVDSASTTDTGKIDRNKTGVAYHMYDSIVGVDGDKATGIKSYLDNPEKLVCYKEFGDSAKAIADRDAQAVQIIAEHNGIEGNMPYVAKWLNENYNTMFLTFPMALVRWGKNRLQSLGYAFMESDSSSTNYLLSQAKSLLIAQTVLLAIQILLSQDSREYLKKKITKKDDEITEEEQKNAENILFRGGCVKLFDSALKGEEVTTTGQNHGPISSLFNSYIADFIPQFNSNPDKDFMTTLKNQIISHTWGHAPFAIKDTVESIPGNTALQTVYWYEPGDNFFDNYGRKILGYSLGTVQANAFMDYLQAHNANNDLNSDASSRLRNAMTYAFSNKYSNIKYNKAETRNYKKAFEIFYNYYAALYGNNASSNSSTTDSGLKATLKKALETSNSSADVYFAIQKTLKEGTSYSEVQKALKSISLREKLLTMPNYNAFIDSLNASDKATIKSALLYEENQYPYLDDILSDINTAVTKESNKQSYSSRNTASILRGMSYNTPTYYNYNSNYSNYIKQAKFLKNYNNSYKKKQEDVYNSMRNKVDYGTSTDIWGTVTQHYKDGTEYVKRERGFNPFSKEDK